MRVLNGAEMIARERRRQTDAEGYSYRHDDRHVNDEIALAAVQYALPVGHRAISAAPGHEDVPQDWPWEDEAWKPTPDDRVRELVKAGALIAAEVDRLIRAEGAVHG